MAGSLLEREDREKRPPSDLLGLAPHWLNAPCILLFARPKEGLLVPWFLAPWSVRRKKPSPPGLPLRVVACSPPFLNARARIIPRFYANGYPGSSRHPIVRQLVSVVNTSIWEVALAHITEETLNGIRRLNVPVHALRKRIKRQQVLFILCQAAHSFGIAPSILGFEGDQLGQCLLFGRLLPDAHKFSLNLSSLASGDGIEHVALLVHQTALTRGGRKQLRGSSQQSIMPIGHDEINLGGAS
jgi:hypothetical protein